MPWDFLLLNAAQSASLGSALALLLRLLAVLRRRRQRRKRRVELREVQLMGQLEQAKHPLNSWQNLLFTWRSRTETLSKRYRNRLRKAAKSSGFGHLGGVVGRR